MQRISYACFIQWMISIVLVMFFFSQCIHVRNCTICICSLLRKWKNQLPPFIGLTKNTKIHWIHTHTCHEYKKKCIQKRIKIFRRNEIIYHFPCGRVATYPFLNCLHACFISHGIQQTNLYTIYILYTPYTKDGENKMNKNCVWKE